MLKRKLSPEELAKAREEAERKARRGEIEPTHDFTFILIGHFTGLTKHAILEFIFEAKLNEIKLNKSGLILDLNKFEKIIVKYVGQNYCKITFYSTIL